MPLYKYTYKHPVTGDKVDEEQDRNYVSNIAAEVMLHSFDDQPAITNQYGYQEWRKDGVIHRDGDKPAIIDDYGDVWWLVNGELHRLSGPTVIYSNGSEGYYINHKRYTKEQWERHPDVVSYKLKQHALKG